MNYYWTLKYEKSERITSFDVACAKLAGALLILQKKKKNIDAKTWWAENIDGLNVNSKTQQKIKRCRNG